MPVDVAVEDAGVVVEAAALAGAAAALVAEAAASAVHRGPAPVGGPLQDPHTIVHRAVLQPPASVDRRVPAAAVRQSALALRLAIGLRQAIVQQSVIVPVAAIGPTSHPGNGHQSDREQGPERGIAPALEIVLEPEIVLGLATVLETETCPGWATDPVEIVLRSDQPCPVWGTAIVPAAASALQVTVPETAPVMAFVPPEIAPAICLDSEIVPPDTGLEIVQEIDRVTVRRDRPLTDITMAGTTDIGMATPGGPATMPVTGGTATP